MGRDDALAAIDAAFKHDESRLAVAITALHGLRGVGKSTLAAAYAERCRRDLRLAWWIGAHEDASLRAVSSASASAWAGSTRTRRRSRRSPP
jgi:hypothetical protein